MIVQHAQQLPSTTPQQLNTQMHMSTVTMIVQHDYDCKHTNVHSDYDCITCTTVAIDNKSYSIKELTNFMSLLVNYLQGHPYSV